MNLLIIDAAYIDRPYVITDKYVSYENTDDGFWGDATIHPPLSFHSYAAAMKGRFLSFPITPIGDHLNWADIVILAFEYSPAMVLPIIHKIHSQNKKVISVWKENGCRWHQEICANPEHVLQVLKVFKESDYIATYMNKSFNMLFLNKGLVKNHIKLNNVWPMSNNKIRDKFKGKIGSGVLVGPSYDTNLEINRGFWENLDIAVWYANEDEKVRVVLKRSDNGITKVLDELYPNKIEQVPYISNYYEWLDFVSTNRIVINNDLSNTHGRVTADARFTFRAFVDRNTELGQCTDEELSYENFRNLIGRAINADSIRNWS